MKEFAPDIKVKMSGQAGNQSIAAVEGADAEEFEPYLEHYVEGGHEPAAAVRLAKAKWAAEAAVEAGVIKESTNKRNEKVNQILFPKDSADTFELDLKMHMARVRSAAAFLDSAKVRNLRRKSTCEKVAEADPVAKPPGESIPFPAVQRRDHVLKQPVELGAPEDLVFRRTTRRKTSHLGARDAIVRSNDVGSSPKRHGEDLPGVTDTRKRWFSVANRGFP